MNKKILALLIPIVFLVSACGILTTQTTHTGHNILPSDVQAIVKGKTTEREIVKMFGPATRITDIVDGKELLFEYTKTGGLQWNLGISFGGSEVTKSLIVWLDKSGIVSDYAYKKN